MLRVPESRESESSTEPVPEPAMSHPPRAPIGPTARRRGKRSAGSGIAQDRGLIAEPAAPGSSLAFPLWGSSGVALLLALPPFFWITSLLSAGLVPNYVIGRDDVMAMGALTMIAPMLAIGLLGQGYLGLFLDQVVIDGAAGAVAHPRMPSWSLGRMIVHVWRLLIALAIGCALPALGAFFRFQGLEEPSVQDWLFAALLMAPGLVYAQIALASAAIHDDVLAVNPWTVLSSLGRIPGASIALAFRLLIPAALATVFAVVLFVVGWRVSGTLAVLLTYVFWLAFVYGAMVSARMLGNFRRVHRRALDSFSA